MCALLLVEKVTLQNIGVPLGPTFDRYITYKAAGLPGAHGNNSPVGS
jgi:hypothetical protein